MVPRAPTPSSSWGLGVFLFPLFRQDVTDLQRTALRLTLELEWLKVKEDYEAAGAPFGPGRGLDIWVEYEQLTTVN